MRLLKITTEKDETVFINPMQVVSMTERGAMMYPSNEPRPMRTIIELTEGGYEIAKEPLSALVCFWEEVMVQETRAAL